MTFAKCKTNGESGTFVEEQNGSIASATDRTAYSCSARSLEERARDAANARSFASSPVLLIVPARTRDVTIPRERRSKSSGVAPTKPEIANFQVVGYSRASLFNIARGSIAFLDEMVMSRARTTLSKSPLRIRETAVETRSFHNASA